MKRNIDQLAIFGGTPLFDEPLHVGSPNLPPRDQLYSRIDRILDNRWLTNNGEMVQEFERRICELLGVRHCIATVNGTAGIEIAIRAAGLSGEIIVPSFTFVATAHAVEWLGLEAVFCDIDPATHNLDPSRVEELITDRTAAIMGVHVWGRPCDLDALAEIAARRRLHLLYDAAHAFGCSSEGGRHLGNFGDAEVFSFHATKFVNCFEGGAVVTNDDDYAERMRLARNFGFCGKDNVIALGINAKLSEVCAAMGLCSMDMMEDVIAANERNYADYRELLGGVPGIRFIDYDPGIRNNFQYAVAEVDADAFGLTRDELVTLLDAERIIARRYFYPGCHQLAPYADRRDWSLPHTEAVANCVVSLPNGLQTGADDVARVAGLISFLQSHADAVTNRLAELAR